MFLSCLMDKLAIQTASSFSSTQANLAQKTSVMILKRKKNVRVGRKQTEEYYPSNLPQKLH